MIKAVTVFGTRPEAIKLAPVVQALAARPDRFVSRVVVTAQHRQMLDQVLAIFRLAPDHDLNLMRHAQTLPDVVAGVMTGLSPILAAEKPDVVIVQGDTTTTFAAGLAAFFQKIPVAHVEAGLRTYDKYSPFPEEANRRMTSCFADFHFAPTAWAKECLVRENYPADRVWVTGNTVIDALLTIAARPYRFADPTLDALAGRIVLVTAHRRESFGKPFEDLCHALRRVAETFPDVTVVYPVHLNPNVQRPVRAILGATPNVLLTEPLEYEPFVHLMKKATILLTDSGGIQEEGPSLGKPVLVMREKTERPEGVHAGTVRLVGTDPEKIVGEATRLLTDPAAYAAMAGAVNPYGDGKSAARIVDILAANL
jgi:UDP-N-acetylglucosamine 2-epimerase (non-hydrolysing)